MTESDTESSGVERIQFTCVDCGGEVDREPGSFDIEGITPKRCAMCTLKRMGGCSR